MTDKEIMELVDAKIRDHEVRIAIISGIIGLAIIAGLFHAIHLNSVLIR